MISSVSPARPSMRKRKSNYCAVIDLTDEETEYNCKKRRKVLNAVDMTTTCNSYTPTTVDLLSPDVRELDNMRKRSRIIEDNHDLSVRAKKLKIDSHTDAAMEGTNTAGTSQEISNNHTSVPHATISSDLLRQMHLQRRKKHQSSQPSSSNNEGNGEDNSSGKGFFIDSTRYNAAIYNYRPSNSTS